MRFPLFGIPVEIRPMFLLIAVALAFPQGDEPDALVRSLAWLAIVTVSILVHELGHAFAIRAFGRDARIELHGLGGLTHWGDGPAVSAPRRMLVSLAGPFAGFALGGLVALGASLAPPAEGSVAAEAVRGALVVNFGWGVFNLLPMLPLDGGHVMEVLVGLALGDRGYRVARVISLCASGAVLLLALRMESTWVAMIAVWSAFSAGSELRGPVRPIHIAARVPLPDRLQARLDEAWLALTRGSASEARRSAEGMLAELDPDPSHDRARLAVTELIAWAYIEEGDERAAHAALRGLPERVEPSPQIVGRLLVAEGRVEEGLVLLERTWLERADELTARVLAATYVDLGRASRVVEMTRSIGALRLSKHALGQMSSALFHAGHFAESLEVSSLAFSRHKDPIHAYNAACALARLARIDEAIDWLGRAIDAGLSATDELDRDDDLEALRRDPRWAELRARARRADGTPTDRGGPRMSLERSELCAWACAVAATLHGGCAESHVRAPATVPGMEPDAHLAPLDGGAPRPDASTTALVWMVVHPSDAPRGPGLNLLDESRNEVVSRLPLPDDLDSPHALAWDGSSLWLGGGDLDAALYELDPVDGSVRARLPNIRTEGMAIDGDSLWLAQDRDVGEVSLTRLARDGTELSSVLLPSMTVQDLTVAHGAFYYLVNDDVDRVVRFDPDTGATTDVVRGVHVAPYSLAFDGTHLAVAVRGVLRRYDPATGALVRETAIDVPGWITALAFVRP